MSRWRKSKRARPGDWPVTWNSKTGQDEVPGWVAFGRFLKVWQKKGGPGGPPKRPSRTP